MNEKPSNSEKPPLDLCPTLRSVVEGNGLDSQKLSVALEAVNNGHIRIRERHAVPVTDGKKIAFWQVSSLRELFRGNQKPPSDLAHYPPSFVLHFFFVENHFLTLCQAKGDQTDQEMQEIYATLRRRPDGRSLGDTHEFMWQVAALWLGTNFVSTEVYEAFFTQLEHSVKRFAIRPISRNYIAYLRETFGKYR